MLFQTKKTNFKIIIYVFIIFLIFGFSLARAEEEIVQESQNDNNAIEIEINDTPDESVVEDNMSEETEEEVSGQDLAEEDVPILIDESSTTVEQVTNQYEEISDNLDETDIDSLAEIASSTEQITASGTEEILDEDPIIFVFDGLEAENEASSSLNIDDSFQVASTSSSTVDLISEDKNSSSTDSVSSSTEKLFEESLDNGASSNNNGVSIISKESEIIAQWQMLASSSDDSKDIGVQILPSGEYEVDKNYKACVLVKDSGNPISASASIYYPKNIAFDKNSREACGQIKNELKLEKVLQEDALNIVCNQIRNNNNNLLSWYKNEKTADTYNYENVCGTEGFLNKNKASLFCAESSLSYDDPAGEYQVLVKIKNEQEDLDEEINTLKYLELTVFENDFSDFQYGRADLGEFKIIKGDTIFGNSLYPSVRNTGNTRLQIKILQNDFNLGKTDGSWNLEYKARVGENADFLNYLPEQTAYLKNPLNLGETANIDLGILVKKYPEDENQLNFSGEMTLLAEKIPALSCQD